MHRKKHYICRVQCYRWFQASTGGLGTYAWWMGGGLWLMRCETEIGTEKGTGVYF